MSWSQCDESQNGDLVYNIDFQSTWNATEHSSIPAGAHWSDLVIISHSIPNQFLEVGENASQGIKDLAELGNNAAIDWEVFTAINQGTAHSINIVPFNTPNNATASATIQQIAICTEFRYLTILSMVAPSPDWFIAANSVEIIDTNGQWIDFLELDVYAYDAGTDNGTDYDSPNSPNTPVGISLISGFPLNGNKIGTLTFDFEFELLSTPNFEASKTLKIAPNPSKGHISINGDNVANLQSVKVYNILGSLVKDILVNTKESALNLDLSALNKGIYLVKLNTKNGETTTQKLIIE